MWWLGCYFLMWLVSLGKPQAIDRMTVFPSVVLAIGSTVALSICEIQTHYAYGNIESTKITKYLESVLSWTKDYQLK